MEQKLTNFEKLEKFHEYLIEFERRAEELFPNRMGSALGIIVGSRLLGADLKKFANPTNKKISKKEEAERLLWKIKNSMREIQYFMEKCENLPIEEEEEEGA